MKSRSTSTFRSAMNSAHSGLALLRERPRPHQRYLPAQEIRADVERDLTPLADETGGATRRTGGVSISARLRRGMG